MINVAVMMIATALLGSIGARCVCVCVCDSLHIKMATDLLLGVGSSQSDSVREKERKRKNTSRCGSRKELKERKVIFCEKEEA